MKSKVVLNKKDRRIEVCDAKFDVLYEVVSNDNANYGRPIVMRCDCPHRDAVQLVVVAVRTDKHWCCVGNIITCLDGEIKLINSGLSQKIDVILSPLDEDSCVLLQNEGP